MAQTVEKVPAETRWTMATRALTGAIAAAGDVLRDTVGQEKFDEIWAEIWAEQGKASKEIVEALGLGGDDAKSVAETVQIVGLVTMGPEYEFETVESTEQKAVIRTTVCPWWNRFKERGTSEAFCPDADLAWCDAIGKSLNPKMTVSLTKAMPRGDSYCEWVWELQK